MRVASIVLLLFLYLVPSIGISVSAHYCGGRLASITLQQEKDKCICGNKKKKDCCKTITTFIKLSEVHKSNPQVAFSPYQGLSDPFVYLASEFLTIPAQIENTYNFASAHPPNDVVKDIYLVNCVFRI